MSSRTFIVALLTLAITSVCHGQARRSAVVLQLADPAVSNVSSAPSSPDADASAAGTTMLATQAAQPNPNDPKQRRLAKIRQLQFDRRPSTILKTWIAPPEPTPAPPEKAEVAAEPAKAEPTPGPQSEGEKPAEDTSQDKPATEPTAEEKAKAEAAKAAQAAMEQAKQQAEADAALDRQLKAFARQVTLGEWDAVKAFLPELDKEEGRALYERLLESLRTGPVGQQQEVDPQQLQHMMLDAADEPMIQAALAARAQGRGAAFVERNMFAMADVRGLIVAAPHELDDPSFARLGTILRQTLAAGHDLGVLLNELRVTPGGTEPPALDRRQVARLLFAAKEDIRAGDFLPTIEEASAQADAQALNLLARHFLALNAKDRKAQQLDESWRATQAVLAIEPPTAEQPAAAAPGEADTAKQKQLAEHNTAKDEALRRAVELAPRVRDELGQKWLDESFAANTERGREILVTIGTLVSTNLTSRPADASFRLKSLELQRAAVEALLRAAPETAATWQDPLTLLAAGWLREAQVSHDLDHRARMGPGWQRDRYGNYFFTEDEEQFAAFQQNQQGPRPIKTEELLEVRPSDAWLALIRPDLTPKFATMLAQLLLKVNEEAHAFPYIEQLALSHPDRARELAAQFLRVWTSNHNPNENRERSGSFFYIYGYERRAERIPLTRSKQERNLEELAEWVRRLRALSIGELDERLLTQAFTTAHSQAEVYRLESIENVFGSMDNLKPRTLADLIQQMRGNLAGVWRAPDVQKQNSTNRKQRDIEAEVLRGYAVARAVVEKGLAKHPDHWALVLAEAAIAHDENDFQQEIEKRSEFSERRAAALARFRRATELYAQSASDLPEEEQTTQAFEQWFYAALGSVDLARITPEKVPDLRQPVLIRESLLTLHGETAEHHMALFANNLFTRANSAKPELKYRYLRSGFEIVGDHKMAREARKLLDYYGDLVKEVRLEAQIDGPDVVGHGRPFGVLVNIVHTKEIERESGGFGRYLQNQNNNQYYYYNFGRPLENYRDKFHELAEQALAEHFEVVSVTFQEPEVNSKALAEYGWRATPYAYLLLKARGPEVDKLPPLRLDLDFLDTSGYAILPIESPAVPLDAHSDQPPARPAGEISITQTLDERQAADGKLVLEIRAAAHGLVPELSELVELKHEGFKITATEDEGVSVKEFDKEAAETTINSERLWTISLEARGVEEQRPKEFRFAQARLPVKEMLYQRYDDADLVAVEPVIALAERYGRESYRWLWAPISALAAVGLLVAVYLRAMRHRRPRAAPRFQMPEHVTPFTVIGLLRDIEQNNGLSEGARRELADSISGLERHYFQESDEVEYNLQEVAQRWLHMVNTPSVGATH